MAKYTDDWRIVIVGKEGEAEEVHVTQADCPAEDFCRPEQDVIADEQCLCELPDEFPVERALRVED